MSDSPRTSRSLPAVLAAFVALGALGALACASDRDPTRPDAVFAPVQLLSPVDGGRFVQNDTTLGCPVHPARGSGFRVAFDWRDVEGAERYRIVFWQRDARFPAIERDVERSEYAEVNCNAFVLDRNADHWIWKVAAVGRIVTADSAGGAARDTVLWSEEREFGFTPCRLANGVACHAPGEP